MNKKNFIIIAAVCGILFAVILRLLLGAHGSAPSRAPVTGPAAEAAGLEAQGKLLAAKAAYQKLVSDQPNNRDVIQWQRKAEQLNIELLFSPIMTPRSIEYVVMAGDSLEKIARDHKTTVELIRKANNVSADRIYPGMRLKVWNAPFTILVDKSENTLLLKCDEEVMKTYTVATGHDNCTPVGTFRIIEKITNPTWYKDNKAIPASSPENILGTRWMGFDKEGYGIHGTTLPDSLGKQATAGCVRMSNRDVEELYSIVPQGTEVTIVN
ncbi:MAG: L,D-transpeptidase family protein [Deltaproteobacteria bacterium]